MNQPLLHAVFRYDITITVKKFPEIVLVQAAACKQLRRTLILLKTGRDVSGYAQKLKQKKSRFWRTPWNSSEKNVKKMWFVT